MTRSVLLVANEGKPAALDLARDAERRLRRLGAAVRRAGDPDAPLLDPSGDGPGASPDLVVVFGGDGTVLNALHRLGDDPPPILGVNLGRLGFLAEVAPDELDDALPRALDGALPVSERMWLEAAVVRDGRARWRGRAANDVLVAAARAGRITRVEARVDGERVLSFPGDGLLAATPTGSTAYSLSAGGPVLGDRLRAVILTPVCPHRLSLRSLVVGPGEDISIRMVSGAAERMTVDGAVSLPVAPEDEIRVGVAEGSWRLLRLRRERYGVLRRKLGWDEGGDDERAARSRPPRKSAGPRSRKKTSE